MDTTTSFDSSFESDNDEDLIRRNGKLEIGQPDHGRPEFTGSLVLPPWVTDDAINSNLPTRFGAIRPREEVANRFSPTSVPHSFGGTEQDVPSKPYDSDEFFPTPDLSEEDHLAKKDGLPPHHFVPRYKAPDVVPHKTETDKARPQKSVKTTPKHAAVKVIVPPITKPKPTKSVAPPARSVQKTQTTRPKPGRHDDRGDQVKAHKIVAAKPKLVFVPKAAAPGNEPVLSNSNRYQAIGGESQG